MPTNDQWDAKLRAEVEFRKNTVRLIGFAIMTSLKEVQKERMMSSGFLEH